MLKNNITSSVASFAVACLFCFISAKISQLSSILPLVLMVTFAVCSAVADKEYTAISGALSVLVSYVAYNDVIIVYTAIVSAVAGIVIGQMIKKEVSVMSLTVASAVGLVVLYALYIFVFAKMTGCSSLNEIFNMLSETMVQAMSAVDESGAEVARMIVGKFRDLFPSIVIISAVTVGYFVVFITGGILSLKKDRKARDMGFSRLKADGITTVVFIAAMAVTIFAGYSVIGVIAENIYTILTYVLQICGMSLLDWILKNVKKMNIALRIVIIFFVSVIPITSVLLVMAAILDARRNFRGLSE